MNSYFCYNRFMLAPRWLKSLVSACPHRLHSPQQEGIIGGRSEALAFERPIALEASIGRWQTLAIGCLIELERLRVIRHGQRIFHWSGTQLDRAPFEVEQEKKIRSFFSRGTVSCARSTKNKIANSLKSFGRPRNLSSRDREGSRGFLC